MNIGNQIKALRLAKSVKQEELASYLGVSYQAVSKWETGASVPDIALLPDIAVYFGVTIDELFQIPDESEFERIENMFWHERCIDPETFDHAVHFLERMLKEKPEDARAYADLAALYNHRANSNRELANDYAKKAIDLNPDYKPGWVEYLEANNGACGDEWVDNHFTVIEFIKDVLKKHPKNYRGVYIIIENMLKDGWYQAAIPYIEKIRKLKDNDQYEMYMGDVSLGLGDQKKAIEYWNQAVEHHPDIWTAYCRRAARLQKLGKYEEALADFEHCVTMQQAPRITDGLYSMAQIHERLGDFDAAIEDNKRIMKVLREEYNTSNGESIDSHKREIERLKKRKKEWGRS